MLVDDGIRKLFSETRILGHPEYFTLVSIDRKEEETARLLLRDIEAFSSVTFDHSEVSLVVRSDEWAKLRGGFREFKEEGPYSLITFDIVLDLSIVGFLAVVSARLAEAGVSIYALSTFLRDHILVKGGDAEKAVRILNELVEECRGEA
ncbi:MAG: ACT domain-containing protein [Candidatus Bathyarchaeia archaeon]